MLSSANTSPEAEKELHTIRALRQRIVRPDFEEFKKDLGDTSE